MKRKTKRKENFYVLKQKQRERKKKTAKNNNESEEAKVIYCILRESMLCKVENVYVNP